MMLLINLDDIIIESDYLLIDRGDLSKEIPIEKIPFAQKIVLNRSRNFDKKVFVATNLLESMIVNRKPTRAEVHDVINTIIDGAYGLTMAAETAIGKYPIGCINMLNKIIKHAKIISNVEGVNSKEKNVIKHLEKSNYLLDNNISSSLITPHGGELVNRFEPNGLTKYDFDNATQIKLTTNQLLDFEQIAVGVYSPLKGFMTKLELEAVLNEMRLPDGLVWPLPILLDIDEVESKKIEIGERVVFLNDLNEKIGAIKVKDIYSYDKRIIIDKIYGTTDPSHPGVNEINKLNPTFLGGDIVMFSQTKNKHK